jgi:SAM-dependent methyltransferase
MVCKLCGISSSITPYEDGVMYCDSCNGIFRINPNDTTTHHTKEFDKVEFTRLKNKKGDKRFWSLNSDEYVKYLKSKTSMKFKHVLDVGSYYGTFVKSLTDMGMDAEGIEANQNLVRLSVTDKVRHGYFDENFDSNKKFDLISLTQMIYYLPDSFVILKKCHEMLNDDGLIFISTINPESSLVQKKLVPTFQPHVNIFLSKTNYSNLKDFELLDYTAYMPDMFNEMYKHNKFKMIKYMAGLKKPYSLNTDGNHAFLLLKKR